VELSTESIAFSVQPPVFARLLIFFTARCTLVQSAFIGIACRPSVCLSVCPSVRDVGGSGPHRRKWSEGVSRDCPIFWVPPYYLRNELQILYAQL